MKILFAMSSSDYLQFYDATIVGLARRGHAVAIAFGVVRDGKPARLEYNASFGATRTVTIPKDQPLEGAPKEYRGASLPALEKAARRKGYRLVVCDPSGGERILSSQRCRS